MLRPILPALPENQNRCDGLRPQCSPCQKRKSVCEYQINSQPKLGAYEELFNFIATRTHEEAVEALGRIRQGHTVEAVLRHIHDADLLLQLRVSPNTYYQYSFPYSKDIPAFLIQKGNPYLASWLYKYSSYSENPGNDKESPAGDPVVYQIPFHAAEIVDPRLSIIKAKTWTSIIDDDVVLRKLLQIYFLTEYTWFPAFQKDYFLDDMASGGTRYCSPLLVNAILASACHGYSKTTNRAKFWNPQTLGYQFLAEARRLWDIEVGNAQLTTIQAAIVISIVYDANGSDKIGNLYLTQAVSAAHSMHLFSPPTQPPDRTEYNARAVTAWALFGLQAVHSFHVFQAPLLAVPPEIALPSTDEASNCYGDFWLRYPSQETPVSVGYGNTFRAMADFRAIINDLAITFFGHVRRDPGATINRIRTFCTQLDGWYRDLPVELKSRNICFPWQLKLHMHYYNLIIYLLETLVLTSKRATYDISVQQTLSEAKIRLETLLRLYYLRHGYESYDIFMINMLSFLGFIHTKTLEDAEEIELESRRSSVALVAQGLREQSRNCYLALVVFRVLKDSMGVEIKRILQDSEDVQEDEDEEMLVARQVQSSWPMNMEWIDTNPDDKRLENLINKANEIRI
ncbi:hypothetical protein FGRMN_3569 [Fusarium graminum]|nr:hypothetical protein FGRMN_3569 [Fusarium graminum]